LFLGNSILIHEAFTLKIILKTAIVLTVVLEDKNISKNSYMTPLHSNKNSACLGKKKRPCESLNHWPLLQQLPGSCTLGIANNAVHKREKMTFLCASHFFRFMRRSSPWENYEPTSKSGQILSSCRNSYWECKHLKIPFAGQRMEVENDIISARDNFLNSKIHI